MEGLVQSKFNIEDRFEAYYSAEFRLDQSKILYQFKIRKSANEPMFAVVKEDSVALKSIKEGDIINMRFYSLDKSVPARSKDARIKYICKDSTVGFKDHYVVALDVQMDNERILA